MPSIAIFFSDSPTLQYQNKTIFKLISNHKEYFGFEATWNYSEVGHSKGPCDPIGGTAKHQTDMAVRHGKVIIQDYTDFCSSASPERGCIGYLYINVEAHKEGENISADLMVNIQAVEGTMKVHAVTSTKHSYKIKVPGTSCYCSNCCDGTSVCGGWRELKLVRGKAQQAGK